MAAAAPSHAASAAEPRAAGRLGHLAAAAAFAGILAAIALRVAFLHADPYTRLDWDTGILTDEGFYAHNARNLILFGHARTDEFNNMLVMPLWHAVQVVVFHLFGAGAAPARGISVLCGLLTIPFVFAALRRSHGPRTAAAAAAVLALDHVVALYNRMALLDTPSMLLAAAALYCFVRAMAMDAANGRRWRPAAWATACGALLALTATNRFLDMFLLPAPFLAAWAARRHAASEGRSRAARSGLAAWTAVGMALVFALYTAGWYLPHRAELAHMNHYFRTVQAQPHSIARLLYNLRIAVVGDPYGILPFLWRHTPIVLALALAAVGAAACGGFGALAVRDTNDDSGTCGWQETTVPGRTRVGFADELALGTTAYLLTWLLGAWAVLAVSSYSPDRYFVNFYPALAGLASIALWRLPAILTALCSPAPPARLCRGAITWVLAYQAAETTLGPPRHTAAAAALYGAATAVALLAGALAAPAATEHRPPTTEHRTPNTKHQTPNTEHRTPNTERLARLVAALAVLWAAVNGWWLADWSRHIAYTQRDTGRWLEAHLPADGVLLGDVAPGITTDTRLCAVNVMKGLCNDRDPLREFAGRPVYVAMLDGPHFRGPYWIERYPGVVAPTRRILHRRVLKWWIGIYPAPGAAAASEPPPIPP